MVSVNTSISPRVAGFAAALSVASTAELAGGFTAEGGALVCASSEALTIKMPTTHCLAKRMNNSQSALGILPQIVATSGRGRVSIFLDLRQVVSCERTNLGKHCFHIGSREFRPFSMSGLV